MVVIGGFIAYLAWETFLVTLENLVVVVVDLDTTLLTTLAPVDIAVFVVFTVAFAAVSRGIDRLVMGGVREALFRTFRL
jgi:hypothetical protein